ncbi:MAG TPA: cache domain-containing protein [Anaerolineales bacterium]|nr:cache domain-containing protein [Anaerolineales bacterium]
MIGRLKDLFSAPFQLVLAISFSLVAAISIAIGAWAIAQTIGDYLSEAMNERVARDMQLAQTFYGLKLREIEGITERIAADPLVIQNMQSSSQEVADSTLLQQIRNNLSGLVLGGNYVIFLLDPQGETLAGALHSVAGQQSELDQLENWQSLPIIRQALDAGKPRAATEVIPADLLAQAGLDDQARITIQDTPKAATQLFDEREGSAGLALISVSPVEDAAGELLGSVAAFHLFNNDFTLVDRIRDAAGVDTATIFLGDLRVSTNVMNEQGNRAIGTRVSEEVSQVVLEEGQEFVGPAFVVNQDYITRYEPLKDHRGQVVGILYVGSRQASFQRLVNIFNQRILLVALATILFTIFLTTPVSRAITRPLNQLRDLVAANRRVAEGDMSTRVPVRAGGEVGELASSFNSMLDTLQTTQDQLVQSEKLASLGQLAAGVAHELNNPLGTILLYSDILRKELDPTSPYQEDIELIVNETKRCKGIVSALLEFARQNQVVAQPTDLNALIQYIVELEQKRFTDSQGEIVLELDASLPVIQADLAQLHQVLVNLIDNAMDAMPDGGKVTLRTINQPAGMVTLEVEDTGIGIPQEHHSMLFTPFFTTKPVGIGTGLGLPIIYGIVKLHRGQINVRSEINKGTTFTIQLPIKLLGVQQPGAPAAELIGEN